MDREAHHAIQPESPISALLKAGRQPLIKAPAPPPQSLARSTASSLAKQLSSLTLSRHTQPAVADKENANPMAPPPPAAAARPEFGRMYSRNANAGVDDDNARALQQKARLVTSVAAAGSLPTRPLSTASSMGTLAEQAMVPSSSRGTLASVGSSTALAPGAKKTKTSIEVIIAHLETALTCIDANEPYDAPATSAADTLRYVETPCDLNGTRLVAESPRTFLISWLDHSERYGLGYALSDGTVGVYFRDATSMVLAASKMYVDYISTIRKPAGGVRTDQLKRENFSTGDGEEGSVPRELQSRVRVMRYFEKEIMDRLYGADSPLTFCDTARTSGMVFVHKWYKTKDAIVFRLSNGTVQLNFYDHTKLFLTHGAQVVSVIEPLDKTGGVPRMTSWSLDEFVSIARTDRSAREAQMTNTTDRTLYKTRPAERRKVRGLVNKLRYARDVLASTVKPNRPS